MKSNSWEPDIILSDQFASMIGGRPNQPERRLFVAVLLNAIQQYEEALRIPERERDRDELTAWFFTTNSSWPMAFENVCDELGLDASCIRTHLTALARPPARKNQHPAR